jgi:hypothetical protein
MPRNTPDRRINRFRKGQTALSERHLNGIVEGINRLSGINAPTQKQPRGKSGGSSVEIMTFVAQFGDYLECENAALETVYIAKPYELRRSPFDGETISGVTYSYTSNSERDASDGVDTETQFITPNYVAGAEIYATTPNGGTGVVTEGMSPVAVTYLEMNQGRAWAWDGM